MFFVLSVIAIFSIIFAGSLLIINSLKKTKLQHTLEKDVEKGSKESALDTLLKLIRKDPFDLSKRLQAANLFMETDNFKEAILQLNSIASKTDTMLKDHENLQKYLQNACKTIFLSLGTFSINNAWE